MQSAVRTIGLSAVFTCVALTASAQTLGLTRTDYSASSGARGIVVADFNRDGWPDVAVTGTSNTVSILLGARGTGALTLAATIPVGSGPFALAAADFNRDGMLDLAIANADGGTVSVLIGNGNGSFQAGGSIGAHASPRGVAAADWNRDGKLDLIITAFDGNSVQVLSGDGAGHFVGNIPLQPAPHPQGVAAADFDGNGHIDLVVASDSADGLLARYTSGSGFVAVPGESGLNVLAVGDLNGDGWADVAAASTGRARVAIYRGSASGLVYAASYAVDPDPRGITIADVNADGRADVITSHRSTSTVDVLPNDPAHPGAFLPRLAFASGAGSRAVAAADFDGDGLVDVATGNQDASSVSVLTNTTPLLLAGYTFDRVVVPTRVALEHPNYAVEHRGLMTADFNRDGKPDVVDGVAGSSGVAVLLAGNSVPRILAGGSSGHAVGDFNGDGKMDVVLMSGSQIATYIGSGGGSFAMAAITRSPMGGCVPADMNRDGKLDLVCEGQIMLGQGDGRFTPGETFATADYVHQIHVADFNRDGTLDVLAVAAIWYGDGRGHLTAAHPLDAYGRLQIGDVNRDGYPDIVSTDGDTAMYLARGGPSGFEPRSLVYDEGLTQASDMVLADVDADGSLDIVFNYFGGSENPGVMHVVPGHGDGTFGPAEPFALPPGEMVAADLTSDGLVDIAVTTGTSVHVLRNQRNGTDHPPVVDAAAGMTASFQSQITLPLSASDPDQHALFVTWEAPQGGHIHQSGWMGSLTSATLEDVPGPGTYSFTIHVDDSRGAVVSRTFRVTVTGATEIYLHMNYGALLGVGWDYVNDDTAADRLRVHSANLAAPKTQAPLTNPSGYVELSFQPDPALRYKLWVRLKADENYWGNDSIWVQFSGSADPSGHPAYRIGTTAALAVNLEQCSGCGSAGWGWRDDGWGAFLSNGVTLTFPAGGTQTVRIQTREDGVSVDQVVLSSGKYFSTSPGTPENDTTILAATQ